MESIELDGINFSRQLEAYLNRSEGDQLEVIKDDSLIRIKDLGTKDIAKIELLVNERFPVDEHPEELDPIAEALEELGETFESFDRSRNFYELTVER